MSNFAFRAYITAPVPSALALWFVCTCASAKPFPKIVPMAKLHSLKCRFSDEICSSNLLDCMCYIRIPINPIAMIYSGFYGGKFKLSLRFYEGKFKLSQKVQWIIYNLSQRSCWQTPPLKTHFSLICELPASHDQLLKSVNL